MATVYTKQCRSGFQRVSVLSSEFLKETIPRINNTKDEIFTLLISGLREAEDLLMFA
jgi:hypothetical protein